MATASTLAPMARAHAHVERRVADDPDALWGDRAQMRLDGRQRLTGHVIAIKVMIAEAAEREVLIQAEMAELDASAGADIARQ